MFIFLFSLKDPLPNLLWCWLGYKFIWSDFAMESFSFSSIIILLLGILGWVGKWIFQNLKYIFLRPLNLKDSIKIPFCYSDGFAFKGDQALLSCRFLIYFLLPTYFGIFSNIWVRGTFSSSVFLVFCEPLVSEQTPLFLSLRYFLLLFYWNYFLFHWHGIFFLLVPTIYKFCLFMRSQWFQVFHS